MDSDYVIALNKNKMLPSTWCGLSFRISLLLTAITGFLVSFLSLSNTSLVYIGVFVGEVGSSKLSTWNCASYEKQYHYAFDLSYIYLRRINLWQTI